MKFVDEILVLGTPSGIIECFDCLVNQKARRYDVSDTPTERHREKFDRSNGMRLAIMKIWKHAHKEEEGRKEGELLKSSCAHLRKSSLRFLKRLVFRQGCGRSSPKYIPHGEDISQLADKLADRWQSSPS